MSSIFQAVLGFIPKLLMVLCIILIAFIVKLNYNLSESAHQIAFLEKDQSEKMVQLSRIEKQLTTIETSIVEARESWKRLNNKVDEIEKRNGNYKPQVEKVKSENVEIKNLLDTKLPDDFKRLLNESTGSEN